MTQDKAHWGLYLISDETMLRTGEFVDLVRGATAAGVRVVQLRAKSMTDEDLLAVGREVRAITRGAGAVFIVNDRIALARRLEADGVHVGQDDATPEEAREALGPAAIVGLSTHNRKQILDAARRSVDYVGVGPIFATTTKENADPTVGLELLRWAQGVSSVPTVAVGGIDSARLDAVLATGTPNVAVVSAVSRSGDPAATAASLHRRVQEHLKGEKGENA